MIFFPLKWLPWILAIIGFVALVTTGDPSSLISLVIGVVWLIFIYKGKKSRTSTSTASQKTSYNNSVYKAPIQTTTNISNAADSGNSGFCSNCKTPVPDGMSFCMKCGTKVR
jgi:hypothetical protein